MDRSTGLCDAYVKPQLKGVTFDPVQTQVMHIATVAFATGRRTLSASLPRDRGLW